MSKNVEFGSARFIGFLGVIGGAAIAIGVPWVVLARAGEAGLGAFAATLVSLVGVIGGVGLAVVAAFFSIAIPRKVAKD